MLVYRIMQFVLDRREEIFSDFLARVVVNRCRVNIGYVRFSVARRQERTLSRCIREALRLPTS